MWGPPLFCPCQINGLLSSHPILSTLFSVKTQWFAEDKTLFLCSVLLLGLCSIPRVPPLTFVFPFWFLLISSRNTSKVFFLPSLVFSANLVHPVSYLTWLDITLCCFKNTNATLLILTYHPVLCGKTEITSYLSLCLWLLAQS